MKARLRNIQVLSMIYVDQSQNFSRKTNNRHTDRQMVERYKNKSLKEGGKGSGEDGRQVGGMCL